MIKILIILTVLPILTFGQDTTCVNYCKYEHGYSHSIFCGAYPYNSDTKIIIKGMTGFEWKDTIKFIDLSSKDADRIEAELPNYLIAYTEQTYVKDLPFIKSNINMYNRQFFCYINKNGESIVLISFLWRDKSLLDKTELKHPIFIDDGGNYFWQVRYNLKTRKFHSLHVNGKA